MTGKDKMETSTKTPAAIDNYHEADSRNKDAYYIASLDNSRLILTNSQLKDNNYLE